MALKKKVDPLDEIKAEAEEQGINVAKGANGTFTATCEGHIPLADYADPRALLDDMIALIELDSKPTIYTYDNAEDEDDGYVVTVTKSGDTFTNVSLAGALAEAKESVMTKTPVKRIKAEPAAIEGEVLEPVKPNGTGREKSEVAALIAKGLLDVAKILTDLAGTLTNGTAVPFVADFAEDFDEDSVEPKPARSRIKRERKQKEA